MKKYIFLAITMISCFCAAAQIKLIGQSTYGHNGTSYYITDSFQYFHVAGNNTTITQDLVDGYVTGMDDSDHHYYLNAQTQQLDIIARNYFSLDPSYTKYLLSRYHYFVNNILETIDSSRNFFNGAILDSQQYTHTVVAGPLTSYYQKTFFHYNAGNYCDTAWYVNFAGGTYSTTSKNYYIYDANNRVQEMGNFQSTDSINYTLNSKSNYFYNAAGKTDSIVDHSWQAGQWYKDFKTVFNYNGNNMLTKFEGFSYNPFTFLYTPSYRGEYLRNNATLLDTMYNQSWNNTGMKYDTVSKTAFIYSGGVLMKKFFFNFNAVSQLWEAPLWVANINYYYNQVPNAIAEISNPSESLQLYPNPASNNLHVTLLPGTAYSIYSIDGKHVLTGEVGPDRKVNIMPLSPGQYVLRLEEDGQYRSGRFIKE